MKIAMISSWHVHANDYANGLKKMPECEIVAVWDEDAEKGTVWAKELNCKFIENIDVLLQDKSIDGVVITSPTSMHPELMIKAANAGKHIFTEKVLSITLEDALKIKEAVEKNNVKFTISMPYKCSAGLIFAKQMADSGELGELTYARVRNSHAGSIDNWLPEHFYNKEQCGGGAMIDLGAHPMYLLEWILGMPKSVVSTFTAVTGKPVEDNAVTILEYQNGVIGVSETGFVSGFIPLTLEIHGTKGSLYVGDDVRYANADTKGKWVVAEDLPEELPNPLTQWVESVMQNKKIDLGIDDAVKLTAIMAAAYESQNKGIKIIL